jgi:tetratricopeptide (TPR) repeat protein
LTDKAIALKPDNVWYLALQADLYRKSGRLKDCALVLEKLMALSPTEDEYPLELSMIYGQLQNYPKALEYARMLENRLGLSPEVVGQEKELLEAMGQKTEAGALIRRFSEAHKDDDEMQLIAAQFFIELQMIKEAKEVYSNIMARKPNDGRILLALADLSRMDKDRSKMMGYMEKAFSDPSLSIDLKIGVLLQMINDQQTDSTLKDPLLRLSDICSSVHPEDPKGWAVLGDILSIYDNYAAAATAYHKSIQTNKGDQKYLVWQQYLRVLTNLSRWNELKSECNKAIELFPNLPEPYYLKGIALQQNKEFEAAEKAFKAGLFFSGEDKEIQSQFYTGLGDAQHSQGKHAESDKSYDKALVAQPNNAYVLNNYAYYLSVRKVNLEKALEMSKKSLDLMPGNVSFLDTYAWICYQLGRLAEARIWIEKAISSSGNPSAEVHEHYGDILFRLHETETAVQQWTKAKELGGNSPELLKKITEKKLSE